MTISDTFVGQDHGTLYHLIQKGLWEQAKQSGQPYFPPTYEAVSGCEQGQVESAPWPMLACEQHSRCLSLHSMWVWYNKGIKQKAMRCRRLSSNGKVNPNCNRATLAARPRPSRRFPALLLLPLAAAANQTGWLHPPDKGG